MADDNDDDDDDKKDEEAKKKKGGGIVGLLLPAILAGATSFGGAVVGIKISTPSDEEKTEEGLVLPGTTVPLSPFVLSIKDKTGELHAMKMTIAIELEPQAEEASLEPFIPRVRDGAITMLRNLSFEEATDKRMQEELRIKLLERIQELGAKKATAVLITDLVLQ